MTNKLSFKTIATRIRRVILAGATKTAADWVRLGDEANFARRWSEAERAYQTALNASPSLWHIWVQLGHAQKEQGNLAASEASYRRAIALAPTESDPYLHLGHALKLQHRLAEAKASYERSSELSPANSDVATELASLPQEASQIAPRVDLIAEADRANAARHWSEAERLYKRVLDQNPRLVTIWVQYGHALKEQGAIDRAVEAYRQATLADPLHADGHLQLAHLLLRTGNDAVAALEYRLAYDLDQNLDEAAHGLLATGRSPVPRLRSGMLAKGVFGKVEEFRDGHLRGWAVRQPATGQPVDLEIMIDDAHFFYVCADLPRGDLTDKLSDGDGGGFSLALPFNPGVSSKMEVTVRCVEFPKTQLRGSPLVLEGLPPSDDYSVTYPNALFSGKAAKDIVVVVPIFNAFEELVHCVDALSEHTSCASRLLLIDDASSDYRIHHFLDGLKDVSNIVIQRNPENMGYTRTCNLALRLTGDADVVFLNSDTIVGPGWLQGLRAAAYGDARIGTATAISNNAGAFSVPDPEAANPLPAVEFRASYARAVTQASLCVRPEAPTGNGFCLFIRRDCLVDTGDFDAIAFSRGYGEENDFCLRASRQGWRHIVDDRTLVYHIRSASFGESRSELVHSARAILNRRYPEYAVLLREFQRSPRMAAMRHSIRRIKLDKINETRPRLLSVISTSTGGTPLTNLDLMRSISSEYDAWVLRCDSKNMTLYQIADDEMVVVATKTLREPVFVISHSSPEYDRAIAGWLVRFAIEVVHIRHIAWHSLGLIAACKVLSIPVAYSFHDYYAVCPTVKLIDDRGEYCGGICTAGDGGCKPDLWPSSAVPHLKHQWVERWREMMGDAISKCDVFITTSHEAASIYKKAFPWLSEKNVFVVPHGRDFTEMRRIAAVPRIGERLRVLIPGNINYAKGSDLINRIHDADIEGRIEFHVLGSAVSSLKGERIIRHGSYHRDDFANRAMAIKPHIGGIFSIWPETYCHTLTELWSVGLPVAALPFGAVRDRIKEHGGGWLFSEQNVQEVLEFLYSAPFDPSEYAKCTQQIIDWQDGYARDNSIARMSERYCEIYSDTRRRQRSFSMEQC
jgi:GT2 family glycosyltransferase/tetratricopeptide (TPR) repeat protein